MLVSEAMPIRRNHVYVILPNADLRIENFTFKVVTPRTMGNKQIDFFMISLAKAMGTRAVGIILSGSSGDGTEGCKHIKAEGGTTFAQDESAEMYWMPLCARASGYIDFVLPPHKISAELEKLIAASLNKKI